MGQTVDYTLTYRDADNRVHTKIMSGTINDALEAAMVMDEELMDKYDDIDYRKYREDSDRKAQRENKDENEK